MTVTKHTKRTKTAMVIILAVELLLCISCFIRQNALQSGRELNLYGEIERNNASFSLGG